MKCLNKRADIILVYPRTGFDIGPTIAPPHSLLTIAAPPHREGYKVKIIDQRTDPLWDRRLSQELEGNPICVGISTMTGTQIHFAIEAAKVVRKSTNGRTPIVWGGPHPSIIPEQTCKSEYADIVCVGEGDITFKETVKALEKGESLAKIQGIAFKDSNHVVLTPERPLLDVETLLPVPWELINVEDYIHRDLYLKNSPRTLDVGQTSRGCPFKCGFCCSAVLRKRRWRATSADKALELIVEPVKRFNLNGIWLRDDEFYIDRERAYRICEWIVRAGLNISWYTSGTRVDVFNRASDEQIAMYKRAGAYVLKFGAESGSDRILKLINKGITVQDTIDANLRAKKHGIIPVFAFMQGFPTETFDEINQTLDLAFKLKEDNPAAQFESMAPYTALPGTPMYDLAIEYGLDPPKSLSEWANWNFEDYDFAGKKLPWFDYKGRLKIGNLAYMWASSNAVQNVVDVIDNPALRYVVKFFSIPVGNYLRFRIKRKWYTYAPEMLVLRYIHKLLFTRRKKLFK